MTYVCPECGCRELEADPEEDGPAEATCPNCFFTFDVDDLDVAEVE